MAKKTIAVPANAVSDSFMTTGSVENSAPVRSKSLAGVLCMFLGAFGVHQFYLKHIGKGVVILLLTAVMSSAYFAVSSMVKMDMSNWITAFCIYEALFIIRGLVYLFQSEKRFKVKNKVRTF